MDLSDDCSGASGKMNDLLQTKILVSEKHHSNIQSLQIIDSSSQKYQEKVTKNSVTALVCISFRLAQYLREGQTGCNLGRTDGWIECGSSSTKLVHAWGKLLP